MNKIIKAVVLIIALILIGYQLFTLGGMRATSNFKPMLDSLTHVNDSLALQNTKDSIIIDELVGIDNELTHKIVAQKSKVGGIRGAVKAKKAKVESYDNQELVSYFNQRYPKDTVTNQLLVAQPVLVETAKDLVAYDGAKEELVVKDDIIVSQDQKIAVKDSIITLHESKGSRYRAIIWNQDLKIDEWTNQYNKVSLENRKMKIKNKFIRIGTGVLVGGLVYMAVAK